MNKLELVQRLSEKLGRDKEILAKKTVDLFFNQIKESLLSGEDVEVRGFGVFRVKTTEAHVARNPRTGEQVQVPSRRRPVFKVGLNLKERINK